MTEGVEAGRRHLMGVVDNVPGETEFLDRFVSLRDEYRVEAAETLVEWSVPQLATRLLRGSCGKHPSS